MPLGETGITVNSQNGFVTQDPEMLGLLEVTAKIAPTNVPVLILGESGTGKELIAKRVHELSRRAHRSLVSINCGALQETLLLSELFGHEKGAFTGATAQKKGLVEVADGGTLFLDEIGEMGLEAQAKLLRFLQEGECFRVGGQSPIRVDVRIVSATNKELKAQVKAGKFREDLFYRINTFAVSTTPLRKRPGDIALLIERFFQGGAPRRLTPRALDILQRYAWPGNVRELQNVVERFKILVEGDEIDEADIPPNIRENAAGIDEIEAAPTFLLEQIEKRHILKVLAHFKGNKTRAANAMGITVKTLYNKLAQYEREQVTLAQH